MSHAHLFVFDKPNFDRGCMEDRAEEVDFFDDILLKGDLQSYYSLYGEDENIMRPLESPLDSRSRATSTPLDDFPWDSLASFEQRPSSLTPLSDVDLVGKFFDIPANMEPIDETVDLDAMEATLLNILERNRAYQKELRQVLVVAETASAENKQDRFQLHSLAPRFGHINRGRKVSAVMTNLKGASSLSKQLDLDPRTAINTLDLDLQVKFRSLQVYRQVVEATCKWPVKEQSILADAVRQSNQKIALDHILSQAGIDSLEARQQMQALKDQNPGNFLWNVEGIDWEFIAKGNFGGTRTGKDCQIQWTVNQHPLINNDPNWSQDELTKLRALVQQYGDKGDWVRIATELGTNRPAYQCLAVYQKKIRKDFLKGRWSAEEDERLLSLCNEHRTRNGDCDWVMVVTGMKDRTGAQCIHRFLKTLDPEIKRGRWTAEENARLCIGTRIHGKDWYMVCRWVPGRTDMQCRERWMNVLDPALKTDTFSPEEDELLLKAVEEAGGPGCWASIVSSTFPERTDNQLRRRYRQLTGVSNNPGRQKRPKAAAKPKTDGKMVQGPAKRRGRPPKKRACKK